jgi:hypothetical protein
LVLPALAISLLIAGVVSSVGVQPAAAAEPAGTATCAPITQGRCGDLINHGGPVMLSVQSHTIYWDPTHAIPASYVSGINAFLTDFGSGAFYDSVLQYPGSNGTPQHAVSMVGTTVDTTPYPASRPGTQLEPLTDSDIQAAVLRAITANPSWGPPGMTRAYHVLLPKGVYVEIEGFESFVDFCAYHNDFVSESNPVIYSTLPYAGTDPNGCGVGGSSPTGDADVDGTASMASHELMEMATDPLGTAWYDVFGNENGDLCAFVFGPRAADGGNVSLNGHRYVLQLEWSNADDISPPNYHAACLNPVTVRRLAGPDRIATAVLASQDVWATIGSLGSHAATAVIARFDDYADALAGVPLAGAERGPLLLTPPSGLDSGVAAEIQRTVPAGATVYVLGGTAALSPSVDAGLQQLGYRVTRLSGSDRYGTAVDIATKGLHDPDTVLLATGIGFADALAAGAAAAHEHAAVLLTNGSTMPAATASYLSSHTGTRYAIGGPAAAADPSATDIVGADRYDTATRVATRFFAGIAAVDVATGTAFPDALGGGTHAAFLGMPLLLTDPTNLSAAAASYLQGPGSTATDVVVFGGTTAVGDNVLSQINAVLASNQKTG